MTLHLHRLSVLWKNWMFNQEPEQDLIQDQISEPAASQNWDQSEQGQSSSGGGPVLPTQSSSTEAQLGHVFQVDNASEVEERALQREASQRRSRRRFRKVNPRGERELITDGQEPTVMYSLLTITVAEVKGRILGSDRTIPLTALWKTRCRCT